MGTSERPPKDPFEFGVLVSLLICSLPFGWIICRFHGGGEISFIICGAVPVLGYAFWWAQAPYRAVANKFNEAQAHSYSEASSKEESKYRGIGGHKFEIEVAKLFERRGFEVTRTPFTGDGGWDISVIKDGEVSLVECKAYSDDQKVGRPALQKLHSAMVTQKVNRGVLVTTSSFSAPAVAFAALHNIELIDGKSLLDLHRNTYGANPDTSAISRLSAMCSRCGDTFHFVPLGERSLRCSRGHNVQNPLTPLIDSVEAAGLAQRKRMFAALYRDITSGPPRP